MASLVEIEFGRSFVGHFCKSSNYMVDIHNREFHSDYEIIALNDQIPPW